MQIDHLVYVAADLDATIQWLEQQLGVRPAYGGKHPALGTHNALLGLGGQTYLEVIAPDPAAAQPLTPVTFGLADDTHSQLLASWAIACDDIAVAIGRSRARGLDPGDPVSLDRIDEHGNRLTWQMTLNFLNGGVLPFLIDWGRTPHPSQSAPTGLILKRLHIEHPDPDQLRPRLTALGAEVDVRRATTPALVAQVRGPTGTLELH